MGIAGPNIARVSIIEAEKCTQIDITCGVTINDDLPGPYFLTCSVNDVEWRHIQQEPGIWINLNDSGAKKLQKFGMSAKCTKLLKFMSIIDNLRCCLILTLINYPKC